MLLYTEIAFNLSGTGLRPVLTNVGPLGLEYHYEIQRSGTLQHRSQACA